MPWWTTPSLTPSPTGLTLDGHDVAALARDHGTPLLLTSAPTVRRELAAIRAALGDAGVAGRVLYALKANRAVLGVVRGERDVGIDACSPREIRLALDAGFAPHEIHLTASALSDRDLDAIAQAGVGVTLDTRSALRRYGARVPPGTRVGLRLDPGVRCGYGGDPRLAYGGAKFGFDGDALGEALDEARRAGLVVEGLHVHLGWGLQRDDAEAVDVAFARLAGWARSVPELAWIDVGGGLGARLRESDRPLPLATWSASIRRHLAALGVPVWCEPGTAVVGPAGLLVVEVNTVETRRGVTWVGVDAGHASNPCPALYGLPITVIPVRAPAGPATHTYTVVGNINEAGDVWARDVVLPELHEGDLLALYPSGAYASSMASDHCLRGQTPERVVETATRR